MDFCLPWDCVQQAAENAAGSVLDMLAEQMVKGVEAMLLAMVSWLLMDSVDIGGTGAVRSLQGWVLPIAALVLTMGVVWQGILLTISRRGEPLLQAVKGLWTTALWGAVAIAGTAAALTAGDRYSCWVLAQGLRADQPGLGQHSCNAGDVADAVYASDAARRLKLLLLPTSITAIPAMTILIGLIVLVVALIQAVLMVFRNAALLILAGLAQLAAAGTVTKGTSPWLTKVLGWMLALVAYKPIAATVYAVGFLMLAERKGQDPGLVMMMGLAMLVLALVALPALMKFFTWTVGSVAAGGGGLGMMAAAAAGGIHAGATMRGLGGYTAGQHSRYLNESLGPPAPPAGGGGPSPTTGGGGPTPPVRPHGPTAYAPGGAVNVTAGGGGSTGAAAAAGAAGATSGAATGAAAIPVAGPVIAGTFKAAEVGVQATRTAANHATNATQGG